ncbi:hypothetical protein B0H19DRAFT_89117 [Mycena capillaripes]|nr:hypothetical protein B0H19DRAFT_89117 [Mycena capillaripes]
MAPITKERTQKILFSAKGAASALDLIAQASQTPFLGTTASLSTSILSSVQTLNTNVQELVGMAEDIHDILCGIITLAGRGRIVTPAVLHEIGIFTETVNKIQIWIESQQRTSKIRRLFRQHEEAAQLQACAAALKHALLDVFVTRSRMSMTTALKAMQQDTQAKHDAIMELLETDTDADSSYSARFTLQNLGASSGSLSLLPASPKIFHGRETELKDLVGLLRAGFPRIAILGPGGMGKTSLAIHDPNIINKYQTRYFISCDSARTCDSLVAIIASNLDLEPSRKLAKVVVSHLSTSPPCMVVLDNFETPREPVDDLAQVEEFLSLLTDVPHVALVITMRGAERPSKVQWTRPFFRPLWPGVKSLLVKLF